MDVFTLQRYLDGLATCVVGRTRGNLQLQSQVCVVPLNSAYWPQTLISLTLKTGALQMLNCLELS